MLKNKQKKTNKDDIESDDSIQAFRGWIRKLEQSTNSISGRLSAVEKRLSKRNTISYDSSNSESKKERPIGKIVKALKEEKNIEDIEEISNVIDDEFLSLQDEIVQQQTEIEIINTKLNDLSELLTQIKEDLNNDIVCNKNTFVEFKERIQKMERKEPPTVKLGKMEIPIEVTGIIGGIFAFIIAIFVAFGQNDIVLSPLFLFILGIILIASALFKTYNLGNLFSKQIKDPDTAHPKFDEP